MMMTVPSIALFGLLIPLVGIGEIPVVIALVLYAQLPIIRNTYLASHRLTRRLSKPDMEWV